MTYVFDNYIITARPGYVRLEDMTGMKAKAAWGRKADRAIRAFTKLIVKGDNEQTKLWIALKASNGF